MEKAIYEIEIDGKQEKLCESEFKKLIKAKNQGFIFEVSRWGHIYLDLDIEDFNPRSSWNRFVTLAEAKRFAINNAEVNGNRMHFNWDIRNNVNLCSIWEDFQSEYDGELEDLPNGLLKKFSKYIY